VVLVSDVSGDAALVTVMLARLVLISARTGSSKSTFSRGSDDFTFHSPLGSGALFSKVCDGSSRNHSDHR